MFYGHVVVFANPIPPVVFCPSFAPLFLETRCILDLIHQSGESHDSSRPAPPTILASNAETHLDTPMVETTGFLRTGLAWIQTIRLNPEASHF